MKTIIFMLLVFTSRQVLAQDPYYLIGKEQREVIDALSEDSHIEFIRKSQSEDGLTYFLYRLKSSRPQGYEGSQAYYFNEAYRCVLIKHLYPNSELSGLLKRLNSDGRYVAYGGSSWASININHVITISIKDDSPIFEMGVKWLKEDKP